MKLKLVALSLGLIALTSASYADTVFYNGSIDTTDLTAHVTGQSTSNSGIQYYDLLPFTVTTSGAYTFELSSRNTAATGSNALDPWLAVFTNVFNPVTPGSPTSSNDDFTGTLTVLPGPFGGAGVTSTATGFQGAQPSSRILNLNLTAGTNYFLYVSSFRATTYVRTGTEGNQTGPYWGGITGPGTIVLVPEPSTVALLGLVGVVSAADFVVV